MTEFSYRINDPAGLHLRPVGLIVKQANKHKARVTISIGEKMVDAKKIFSVMSLNLNPGEEIRVVAQGIDEEEAKSAMLEVLDSNL